MATEDSNPPSGGTVEPLTIRGAVNQLIGERKIPEPAATPAPPPPQEPAADDAPDPADLEALEATEQPDDQPQPDKPKYRLDDGYEASVDEIAEWRKGALRQADYTRKTQELAEQRRQFGAQWQQFQQNQQATAQAIDQAIAIVTHFMPEAPTEDLRKQDFFAWQEKKADYDAQIGKLQQLHAWRGQIAQVEQQKQRYASLQRLAKEQEALLAMRPELRDPAKAVKYTEEVKKYGVSRGYTPQEVAHIRDHRLLAVVDDAMKYQKLMAAKAKLSEKAKDAAPMAPPVQTPGRRQSVAEREAAQLAPLKKAFESSAESGSQKSLRDAARLLAAERAASLRK